VHPVLRMPRETQHGPATN